LILLPSLIVKPTSFKTFLILNICSFTYFCYAFCLKYTIINTRSIKITFHELERFSPFLIILYAILTKNIQLLFGIGINWYANQFLKDYFFKPLMKERKIPIIGYGTRPIGAKNCGYWSTGKKAVSYGMPSKHAQVISYFCMTYFINNFPNKYLILLLCLRLLYSRIEFGCHTFQQVIIGSCLGVVTYPLLSRLVIFLNINIFFS